MIVISNPSRRRVPLAFNVIAGKTALVKFERMIRSIAPVADQITVVFDETASPPMYDIARRYGADITTSRWVGDFAGQRNIALDMSRYLYNAWMDTDESLRPDVARRIASLMTAPRLKAFYLWQASPSVDGSVTYVPQIRIFPRLPGVRWEIPAHEQIYPSLERAGVRTELTDLRIEHSGYWNERRVRQKNLRNLKILARWVQEHPEDRFSMKNYQNAVAFERSRKGAAL